VDIAALITWIITAGGGFYLLATWIAKGGARRTEAGATRFPPAVIFSHLLLAAAGLVVWIIYLAVDMDALAWTAFGLLAVVALLGFTMFALWLPTYRAHHTGRVHAPTATPVHAGGPAHRRAAPGPEERLDAAGPAERHFPVPVVALHGLLAATTLVLVLLTALNIGGS